VTKKVTEEDQKVQSAMATVPEKVLEQLYNSRNEKELSL